MIRKLCRHLPSAGPLMSQYRIIRTFSYYMTIALITCVGLMSCIDLSYLLPYRRAGQDSKLKAYDETSSVEFPLDGPIHFYDSRYSSVFVNSNGILSFLTEIPSFVNKEFPIGYPIIAPFYSDIDLTQGGAIHYGKHTDQAAISKIGDLLTQNVAIDADNFTVKHLFAATWDNVKGYLQDLPENNTFQTVLASDDNRTYAIFLYPRNGLTWYSTRARTSNVPAIQAQVGFDAGDGFRTYKIPKTKGYKVLSLSKRSNIGIPGIWVYHIGFVRDIEEPFPMHPTTENDLVNGLKEECDKYDCPINANCVNYSKGFCCNCNAGHYGNGIHCLINNSPQRINGKLNGIINGQAINAVELHSYIVTVDGRIYTALSQVPPVISHGMKLVLPLTESINWLFANNAPNVSNGFILTGGVFNRSVSINFATTGEQVDIREYFQGIDTFGNLVMNAEIQGDLPLVESHSQIEFFDYMQEYKNVGPGKIISESKLVFKIDQKEKSFTMSQEISFEECQYSDRYKQASASILAVTRNFAVYDERERVLRFASQSKIKSIEHNPCKDILCPPYSTCTFVENSYRCMCNNGYHKIGELCKDIDECKEKMDRCHPDSICVNNPGSYSCNCKLGYMADGVTCIPTRKDTSPDCSRHNGVCHADAECYLNETVASYLCRCKYGYVGDGIICDLIEPGISTERLLVDKCSPSQNNTCDMNADCLLGTAGQGYQCECKIGYYGNGTVCHLVETFDCTQKPELCDARGGQCHWDPDRQAHHCRCKVGFVGDGTFCKQIHKDEEGVSIPVPVAEQIPRDCSKLKDICDLNAECYWDTQESKYMCRCKVGFVGNGLECLFLNAGSTKDCSVANNCHHKAQCTYDTGKNVYECLCNPGYYGDGVSSCLFDKSCKYDPSICGHDAGTCNYDPIKNRHACQCHPGYINSGDTCVGMSDMSCGDNPTMCHSNAACVQFGPGLQDFKCKCNYGYIGDGKYCQAVNPITMGLIYAQGSSIMQIPVSLLSIPPSSRPPSNSRKRQNYESQGTEDGHLGHYLSSDQSQIAVGVAADCMTGNIYWTDVSGRKIKRSSHDGTMVDTFMDKDMKTPELLAIDWVSRNIFWTDSEKRTLEMASIDGKHRRIIVNQNLINPRGIAVDWREGRVYWTDWNRDVPKIESCLMDGTDRKILVTDKIKLPNSLIFDDYSRDLCWVDAGTKRLECINVHSNARRTLVSNLTYPFGLTQTDSNFYWTDWKKSEILSAEKQRGLLNPPLNPALGGNGRLYGITSILTACPRTSNACSYNKGGCKFICVPVLSNQRLCLCPDNVDQSNCVGDGSTLKSHDLYNDGKLPKVNDGDDSGEV